MTPAVRADIERITGLWRDCRKRFAGAAANKDEGFLFGTISAADAMYAPVVSRFHTYGIEVSPASAAYMHAVMGLPAWQEWYAAALKEEWLLEEDEVDWPTVLRVNR